MRDNASQTEGRTREGITRITRTNMEESKLWLKTRSKVTPYLMKIIMYLKLWSLPLLRTLRKIDYSFPLLFPGFNCMFVPEGF